MTVTKGKKNYSFPVGSGNTSDVESMHLGSAPASDTESLNNEPTQRGRVFAPPVVRNLKKEEQINLKKNSGRKKLRRYQNRCLLQTLAEEDEDDAQVVVMESFTSPFTKLLQDKDALQFWNEFVEKSEQEQTEFIAAFSKKKKNEENVPKDKPFTRISSKLKRTIKIKKNLSMEQVKKFEDDLLDFFKGTPDQVYVRCPATYFERLLLVTIAQYHGLQTLRIMEGDNRRIEIYNIVENWIPAECFLTDFVAQLRK